MRRTPRARLLLLLPAAAAGVLTLLASSTFEENPADGTQPTTVDWVLGSLAAPLVWDRGDRVETITNLRLAGSYDASTRDDLTLDRDRLPMDATSGFDLQLVADDPDTGLSGTLRMDVLFELDFGLDRDPTSGQYAVLADGTTTLVTAQANPAGAVVEVGGGSARLFDWNELRNLADEENADLDLRLASAAFLELSNLVRMGLLGEGLMADVERNRDGLENVGLDSPVDQNCDQLAGDMGGESVLIWRADASGSGQGDLGAGDSVEARFENCRSAALERYREGTLAVDAFTPARGDPPRTLAGQIDFGQLFLAEKQVSITTVPEPDSPRIDGGLDLSYIETLAPAP